MTGAIVIENLSQGFSILNAVFVNSVSILNAVFVNNSCQRNSVSGSLIGPQLSSVTFSVEVLNTFMRLHCCVHCSLTQPKTHKMH